MPDIERINFPDGAWWELRTVVTRGMRKAFRRAGLQATGMGAVTGNGDSPETPDEFRKLAMGNFANWNLDAVDDAYLVEGTVAWSWNTPISIESIDGLPSAIVDQVLEIMRKLYGEIPEESLKN